MNNDKAPAETERLGALAIYHCSLRVFSRSDGHSAVAAAAYRAGAMIHDDRAGRKREDISPQYKQEPYEPETPKESKMSGAFGRAAVNNESELSPEYDPHYQP